LTEIKKAKTQTGDELEEDEESDEDTDLSDVSSVSVELSLLIFVLQIPSLTTLCTSSK